MFVITIRFVVKLLFVTISVVGLFAFWFCLLIVLFFILVLTDCLLTRSLQVDCLD